MVVDNPPPKRTIAVTFLRYNNLQEIGGGTFGTVYQAEYCGKKYAIKKYTYGKEAIHHTTIREIKALRSFDSPYILPIIEIAVQDYQVHAVFPYYSDDLSKLLAREAITLADCRDIFRQILYGLREVHQKKMAHRDLKPANVLIKETTFPSSNAANKGYSACICDFGMSRQCNGQMTPGMVTLWYRAPEILLGYTGYGSAADIWSAGCILYEMLRGSPLFKGTSEPEQLAIITRLCGSIDEGSMPKCGTYPFFSNFKHLSGERTVAGTLLSVSPQAASLLDAMLTLDPEKRCTVEEALDHPFLKHG